MCLKNVGVWVWKQKNWKMCIRKIYTCKKKKRGGEKNSHKREGFSSLTRENEAKIYIYIYIYIYIWYDMMFLCCFSLCWRACLGRRHSSVRRALSISTCFKNVDVWACQHQNLEMCLGTICTCSKIKRWGETNSHTTARFSSLTLVN